MYRVQSCANGAVAYKHFHSKMIYSISVMTWIGFALGLLVGAGLWYANRPGPVENKDEEVTWQHVKFSTDPQALKGFLDRYPKSLHAPEITRRLSEMDRAELTKEEDAAWAAVRKSLDPAAFDAFVQKYPNGVHRDVAEKRATALRQEQEEWAQV